MSFDDGEKFYEIGDRTETVKVEVETKRCSD